MHPFAIMLPVSLLGVGIVKGAVIREKESVSEQAYLRRDAVQSGYIELDMYYVSGKYLVALQLGSNKDVVHVLVDTGSSDLWVPSIDDVNCIAGTNVTTKSDDFSVSDSSDSTGKFNCSVYGTFDYAASTTYTSNETDFAIIYGSSSIALGGWGQDYGYVEGEPLGEINFAVAGNSTDPFGVLGIGFPQQESTEIVYEIAGTENATGSSNDATLHMYENFPEKLKANGIISRTCYSVFSDQDSTGQLLFGAIDHSKYEGPLYKFPMVDAFLTAASTGIRAVSATLNSLSIINEEESTTLVNGYLPVVFDTGTAIATLPYTLVKLIQEQLNLTCVADSDVYSTNCSSLDMVLFGFNFQGVDFNVPVLNFFLQLEGSDLCGFAAAASYVQGYLVLGQAFLDSVYMSVDLEEKSVALAYANLPDNGDSDIEVITTGIPNAVAPPSAQTYDVSHMVYSTVPLSATTLRSRIDYSSVYVKSLNVAETSSTSADSASSASFTSFSSPVSSTAPVSSIRATTATGAAPSAPRSPLSAPGLRALLLLGPWAGLVLLFV